MENDTVTVMVPLTITVRPEAVTFNGLVEQIQAAGRQAMSQLLDQSLRELERRALRQEPGRWVNRGQQSKPLQVPWGQAVIRRTRVRDQQTGRSYNLADRLVGLRPYLRRWWRSVEVACGLAAELSYRKAWRWWRRWTGWRISLMGFWRMVQRAGAALARREREDVGEIRPGDPAVRAVRRLYLEADAVWLRLQRWPRRRGVAGLRRRDGSQESARVRGLRLYVGVSYSQLLQTGRRRRNAVDKQILVEAASVHVFGRQWAWQVSRRFDLTRTPNQLFLCDGDDGLLRLPKRYFSRALVQLDRFHVHQQLGRAFGLQSPGYKTALSALCAGKLGRVCSLLALRGVVSSRGEVCQEVREYLVGHEAYLWTHRQWRQRTTVSKMGSGVVEKTIETQINRRMKKQGMSWSISGARHLAKLRVLYADGDRWETYWSRRFRGEDG